VLPLKNLSAEKANEYFSDGITDDIITQLSKVGDLKVVSRTSVMRYKSTDKSLREIATELNVATILEGSVRRADNRVRISLQLIDAGTDEHVWAETYDRELKDVFEIQSDVANQVATALKAKFSLPEKERIGKKPTTNLAAYDLYLRGRAFYYLYSEPDNERAIGLFQKALELDPNYAPAYAGLSGAYSQRVGLFGFQPGWIDTAIEVAEKAISLDPNLAEGHKALGLAVMQKGWYRRALQAYQKALELNPNLEPAVSDIGVTNLIMGRFDEALPWMKRSLALDPATNGHQPSEVGRVYLFLADDAKAGQWFSKALEVQRDLDDAHLGLTWLYLVQQKYQQAFEQSGKILAYSPHYVYGLQAAGTAKLLLGDYAGAKKYFERSIAIRPAGRGWMPPVTYLTSSGYVLWKTGQKEEARKMFDQSLQLDQTDLQQGNESFAVRYDIAAINAVQGNKAEAYKWLQQTIDSGFRNYRFSLIDPLLENLHGDERFKQMMTEVTKQVDEMRKRAEAQ
jgi:TolB-like protein/Flp pilus assembly protein TadD